MSGRFQMQKGEELLSLSAIFDLALRAARKAPPLPEVHARFYPYAGLSSTIRLREGRVYARVSDVLQESPPEVLYALACILFAKLYRRRVSPDQESIYRQYTLRPEVASAVESTRRRRGYKIITSAQGRVYNLEEIFDRLNGAYFESALERPRLSWSTTRTRRVLGHHDPVHDTIIVSKTLDSPQIPRLVLEYVVYHEMLHIK
ncbi:MAG TPA: M48 family peptidase, partial [Blastocatellia bacterium]|nr:M48 family peptidase [Blastocatellia bacterium]